MKQILLIAFLLVWAAEATDANLESALKGTDEDAVVAIYKAKDLPSADIEKINAYFADKKPKYRKLYLYAIRDKGALDSESGVHIHRELMRLIKDNLVEDDIEYTTACLAAAGPNKNSDLIYAIAPFVVHPRAALRAEANKAVALKKDERVYPLLGQLLAGENPIDKIYAMETLLALKDERAVPLLLLQISNSNKNVRYFALKTLDAIRSDKAQYGIIDAAEKDADDEVRLKAVEILRDFKTGPVTNALQKLIADKKLEVRRLALESALFQKSKTYAGAVSDQLARETDGAHKHALLNGLFTLGSGGGMNGVIYLLKNETDGDLLLWAAFACNRFSESKCAEYLAGLLQKPQSEAMQVEIVNALGAFKQKKYLTTLFGALNDDKNSTLVRTAALVAIQQFDAEATIAPLFERYTRENDQTVRVRTRALIADLMRRKLPKL